MYELYGCAPGSIRNLLEKHRELKRQRKNSEQIDNEIVEYDREHKKSLKMLLLHRYGFTRFLAKRPILQPSYGLTLLRKLILLLGSGESGKSTIFKQMKLMHEKITDNDYINVKPIIYANVITAMGNILNNMNRLGIVFEEPRREEDKETVMDVVYNDTVIYHFTADVYVSLVLLWMDGGVQECYKRRNEYQLADCAKYFLDRLHHLHCHDYVPSTQDMLNARMITTKIVHLNLLINNVELKVIDVGGQTTERRKWIHYFDDVECVIFVTAISEFNQMMREDNTCNRLLDSLSLFHGILKMSYFNNASVVLFLNKMDLFREKIDELNISIKTLFEDYNGRDTYDESLEYIKKKFIENQHERVYSFSTCATDSNQVQNVVKSCENMVISKNMEMMGLD